MHLHLLVPDLIVEAPEALEALECPALETLLARGRRAEKPLAGLERWLAAHFGAGESGAEIAGALPLAPYRLRGDGVDPGDAAWICLDPVHLQVQMDSLALDPNAGGTLSADEASALSASLAKHLEPEGITLVAPVPSRWYARLPALPAMTTHAPAAAARKPLDAMLPGGPDGAGWRARMTEAQMVLFEHPVNVARESRGAAPVNAVWPWAAGIAQPLATRPRAERWFTDSPLARGLALAAQTTPSALPPRYTALEPGGGQLWVLADGPQHARAAGDAPGWREAIGAIERDWAAPALAALRTRRIGMITLHAPADEATLEVETVASDLRYFWRRRRPLASYLA